jgi:hypothetical protein
MMSLQNNQRIEEDIPKAKTSLVHLLSPLTNESIAIPRSIVLIEWLISDIIDIYNDGLRKAHGYKGIYWQNRDFFEMTKKCKDDGVFNDVDLLGKILSDKRHLDILHKIRDNVQESALKKQIDAVINAIPSINSDYKKGIIDNDLFHYLSNRNSGSIITQELNHLASGDILLGYAMNNCLDMVDIYRYHCNPDARIHAFWWAGKRVGISYDIHVNRVVDANTLSKIIETNLESNLKDDEKIRMLQDKMRSKDHVIKEPLIDSIEIGDSFFSAIEERFATPAGVELPKNMIVRQVVRNYLYSRLQYSDTGIYVQTDSNNLTVQLAISDFIKELDGVQALSYDGTRIKTDVDFKRVPYYVSRASLSGKLVGGFLSADGQRVDSDEAMKRARRHLAPDVYTKLQKISGSFRI